MDKPSYKELESTITELRNQIELVLSKSDIKEQELDIRNEELEEAKEKIKSDAGDKKKLTDELFIINKKLKYLLQLNADKDRFISILAHDLKSPFNGILGLLDILDKSISSKDIDYSLKVLNIINKSAKNTFNLLEELITWTKSQLGNLPYNPQVYKFKDVCYEVIEFVQPITDLKEIEIFYSEDEEIPVFADITMLKTILRNLLSNAIKFTIAGGKIEITSDRTQNETIIYVSDSGVGISPEVLERLFKISSVQSTKGTADEKGSGLGLIICKELTEKHRGNISVESELGKGSKFKLVLPLKD